MLLQGALFVSARAYSFPLAALSIATLRMAEVSGLEFFRWPGAALVLLAATVIALLMLRTLQAIRCGQICQPE